MVVTHENPQTLWQRKVPWNRKVHDIHGNGSPQALWHDGSPRGQYIESLQDGNGSWRNGSDLMSWKDFRNGNLLFGHFFWIKEVAVMT